MSKTVKVWKCTSEGRVVYNRKKHHFNTNDLFRVFEAVLPRASSEKDTPLLLARMRYMRDELANWLLYGYGIETEELKFKDSWLVKVIKDTGKAMGVRVLEDTLEIVDVFGILDDTTRVHLSERIYDTIYRQIDSLVSKIFNKLRGGKNDASK